MQCLILLIFFLLFFHNNYVSRSIKVSINSATGESIFDNPVGESWNMHTKMSTGYSDILNLVQTPLQTHVQTRVQTPAPGLDKHVEDSLLANAHGIDNVDNVGNIDSGNSVSSFSEEYPYSVEHYTNAKNTEYPSGDIHSNVDKSIIDSHREYTADSAYLASTGSSHASARDDFRPAVQFHGLPRSAHYANLGATSGARTGQSETPETVMDTAEHHGNEYML
jgi:hypothetical protein